MNVAVVVPYLLTGADDARARAFRFVREWWRRVHPGWRFVVGTAPEPFNRAPAIVEAVARIRADVFVVADADVFGAGIERAVDAVADGAGWAIPHRLLHRLDEETTGRVLAGGTVAPVGYAERPYVGHEAGTLLVVAAEAMRVAPPDPRFRGWGQEDDAWAAALTTLAGRPWRGTADLWHLWHPPPERATRRYGSNRGRELFGRYIACAGRPAAMRELVAEAKGET